MNFTTNKYKVIFYEKTGCYGNKRQKELLGLSGISFETRSLLDTKWNSATLNLFFKDLEKENIVNPFAPQIKKAQIDINSLSKDELINIMCENPILIKRPLLEVGDEKICGFDIEKINSLLDSNICESTKISTCQSSDLCKSV